MRRLILPRRAFLKAVAAALITSLVIIGKASAQLGGGLMFPGPGTAHSAGGAYTGPGNLTITATNKTWYGLRAYSAATRGNNVVNVCDVTGGTINGACVNLVSNATTGDLVSQSGIGTNGVTCPGTNCGVKIIYDQTAGGNCTGSCDLVASSAPNQPSNMAILTANCIGTKACIRFNSAVQRGDYLTAGNFTQAQPLTISLSVGLPTAATGTLITDGAGSVQPFLFLISSNWRLFMGGSSQDTTVTFNTSMNLQAIINGASTNQYVNATSNPVGSPGTNGWAALPIELGANGGATYGTADVYEISVWSGAFTTTATTGDADKMCHNQFGYWGTTTSC
jgi:hypothetical protein